MNKKNAMIDLDKLNNGFLVLDSAMKVCQWNQYMENKCGKELKHKKTLSIDDLLRNHDSNIFNLIERLTQIDFQAGDYHLYLKTNLGQVLHKCFFSKTEQGLTQCLLFESQELEKQKSLEEKLRTAIFEESFKEGYAESAAYILHNIGNKLCSLITELEELNPDASLLKINEVLHKLINKNELTLEASLKKILYAISEENENTAKKFNKVRDSIKNKATFVSELVNANQHYAALKRGISAEVDLLTIIYEAFNSASQELEEDQIELSVDLPKSISIEIEKNGLVKSFKNIFLNSLESIRQKRRQNHQDTNYQIQVMGQKMNQTIMLIITDNGIGIELDELPKIFNLGYSSKKDSLGQGMHYCSNFIQSTGGSIQISSDGKDKGATVVISLREKTQGRSLESVLGGKI